VDEGLADARSVTQLESYEAGIWPARTEGIIPAPETTHAIACVIDEARKAKEEGKEKVILFNWSGHGLMDLCLPAGQPAGRSGRTADAPRAAAQDPQPAGNDCPGPAKPERLNPNGGRP
jgi:hypothetical protein